MLRHKVSFTILIFLCVIGFGLYNLSPAQAVPHDTIEPYDTYTAIPQALRKNFGRNIYREQYISTILKFVRQNAQNQTSLTQQDFEKRKQTLLTAAKKRQIADIIVYDVDLDGTVTFDEIQDTLFKRHPQLEDSKQTQHLNYIMRDIKPVDHNHDGVITYKEMGTLGPKELKKLATGILSTYHAYLSLDPNQDQTLTIEELRHLAEKAFITVDLDRDSIISDKEMTLYKNGMENFFDVPAHCQVPPVDKKNKLIALAVYNGTALSSVTTAGQDIITTAVTLHIEDARTPKYLVLSSTEPVIWQLSGQVKSIKNLIIKNASMRSDTPLSGVTGIAKDKVTFLQRNCLTLSHNNSQAAKLKTASAFKQLFGRAADFDEYIYKTGYVSIGANTIHAQDVAPPALKTSENTKYHETLWPVILEKHYQNGVAELNPKSVIATGLVEPYIVMPGLVGIAELVQKGAIEIMDTKTASFKFAPAPQHKHRSPPKNASDIRVRPPNMPIQPKTVIEQVHAYKKFRIIKDIPQYPIGLSGGKAVTFYIAKGVTPPAGRPSHSCVVLEETGEYIIKNMLCGLH